MFISRLLFGELLGYPYYVFDLYEFLPSEFYYHLQVTFKRFSIGMGPHLAHFLC